MAARNLLHLLILLVGMLACGLVSVYFGKELNWDLANYHYYNPYYFLQARWHVDEWPSSFVHVNFTPTLDFLTYFLINQVAVIKTVFIMGALHGINFWLLFCIAHLVLPVETHRGSRIVLALLLAFLGIYGPTVLPGMGSFQHDNLVSLFVLGFIYLQLQCAYRYAARQKNTMAWFFLSCVLLGVGVGCKLTVGLFVGGALFTFLLLPLSWRERFIAILLLVLGVTLGIAITSGYWMLFLWQQHHNPFFPLWNGIFHSPDFPFYNWHDERFLPQNLLQTLFYPFYFSLDGRTSDTPFRDFRFAILYVLVVIAGLVGVTRRLRASYVDKTPVTIQGLFLFFMLSYVLWQAYFSIMRYIAVLEMLAPLVIYLLLCRLIHDGVVRFAVSVFVFLFMASMMVPTHMVRAPWYDTSYFNVKMPAFVRDTPEATVLVAFPAYAFHANPRPQAYLIPFFPAQWRFIGIPFIQDDYTVPATTTALVKQNETLYLLASPAYMPKMRNIAATMGFSKPGRCDTIPSDRQLMTHEEVLLCVIKK